MQLVNSIDQQSWYAMKTIENNWSRSTLIAQIESNLFDRQANDGIKTSNFERTLPKPHSDLARDMLKDPYKFDFLTIEGKVTERAIETALTDHIRNFLLELGEGFAFVGTQVPLIFEDQEYFIDMLFYHLRLRCYIVIELKSNNFKPEHIGQLGFYLSVVDDLLRHKTDNQSVGLLLCKEKNKIVAEYALNSAKAPIGISKYSFSKALPKKFKSSLPSIEEIEEELNPEEKN